MVFGEVRHWCCAVVGWLACLAAVGNGLSANVASAADDPLTSAPPASGRVTFEMDVMPILTSAGCNAGACHGKARGQNGFALSLLGFDADFDFASITKDSRGRRVFPAAVDNSLLLRKAAALLPHGGGERLPVDSEEYQVIRRWIDSGLPRRLPTDPVLERITVSPEALPLVAGEQRQLEVTAHYTDGSTRRVTGQTAYQSNESATVAVTDNGLLTAGQLPGEATIMARYMGMIATWNAAIPLTGHVDEAIYASLPRKNLIDGHVWNKLKQQGITPSGPASDHAFLRRVYLDLIGRLPTAEEARAFLDDTASEKRDQLVVSLLERPEYADHWANKWVDLLRPNPYRVGIKATFSLDQFVRDSFRRNQPYDQFVRDLVTAQGSTWRNGAVTLFRDRRSPDEVTTMVSQLFLGIRLDCAKCHHHPFEVWGQDDFYSLAAYFAKVGRKGTGLSPPISGSEEMVFVADSGSVSHPLTGEVLPPRPLFGKAPPVSPNEDPRVALVDWMTSAENDYFPRVAANRIWGELMGRGIVDPVDDLRATNPPSNEPLMAELATEFRRLGYDQKQLIRLIATSYAYGLSSAPTDRNVSDTRNFSRHYRHRLRAEVLLDAVSDVTGVAEDFDAMAPDSRANAIWTHRVESLFLDAFGRPDPNQDPPCERTPDTTVVQALHMMNAPNLHQKVTHDSGRAAQLAASDKTPAQIAEELYLLTYARRPEPAEVTVAEQVFQQAEGNRRQATEDLLWALLNTPEFIFKD